MKKILTLTVWAALWVAAGGWTTSGEEEGTFQLDDLAFLSGCWKGSFGNGGVMEEFYTSPSKNLMLGTTRYLRDDAAVQFEFTRIMKTAEGILMTPYPNGKPSSDSFRLTSLKEQEAIFEAPEHDYPKRIIYRANPDGSRTARIDGGPEDSGGQEWRLQSFECIGPQE
ncbi:MAG TPA: DUF6265 family protein [Acidobacteriota bacterium]|nr:DUF6265 family protein [Acidobacteriota bacterium]